jgi:N-acetyltransferase
MIDPPMQRVLQDGAVLLRPMTPHDFDALFAVAADPLIWAVHPAYDRWQEPVFRAFFDEGLALRGAMVILDKASGAIIGHSRFDASRVEPDEVEIGWTFLTRAYWGGDWNRRVKRLMIAHVFDCGHSAAVFLVGQDNIRSRRAMEKIGGVLIDRTHHASMAGRVVVHVAYIIDQPNFKRGPLALPPIF